MPKHPLTCLRFKIAKTTILLPVTSKSNLTTLRETLLSALGSTTTAESEVGELPSKASDIALWKLESPSSTGEVSDQVEENWIRLTDEKSTADKLGLSEAEEVGVSFKDSKGKFPPPIVIRPVDEYEDGMEDQA